MFDRFFLWLSRRIKAAEDRAAPRVEYDVEAAYEKLRRERDPEYDSRLAALSAQVRSLTAKAAFVADRPLRSK